MLKSDCGLIAPSLDHSRFHRAWGVSCRANIAVPCNGLVALTRAAMHAAPPWLFPRRWSCLWHQEPKDRRAKQAHRRNTQKYCRAAKTHSHQAKECSAQRSADSGRGSNDALGQIEVTAATREIGDDQRREHPDHRPTDAIEQLKANEKRRICGQGKH